jgi:Ca2+-binding RTX toxin-like protein
MKRVRVLVGGLLATAVVPVTSAGAATPRFGCQATAVSAQQTSSPTPFAPNNAGKAPCGDSSSTSRGSGTSGSITIGPAAAYTHGNRHGEAPGAGTLASVASVTISGGGDQVTLGSVQAQTSYACAQGLANATGSSAVTDVTVDGRPVTLTSPSQKDKVALDTHGSYVLLNDETVGTDTLVRTGAFVHLEGVGDYILAQATVTKSSGACLRAGGYVPVERPCPAGANYDPASERCLITDFTKQPITVSSPFQNPMGGAVYSLRNAHATFKHVACLSGHGNDYVIVATPSQGSLLTATSSADRILALGGNFLIDGNGGNDCISVTGGSDTIRDGNGKIRFFAGSGSNKIDFGNGDDHLTLKSGTNDVKLGNGADRIIAGIGLKNIQAGSGSDYVSLGAGIAKVKLGNGRDTVLGGPGFNTITVGDGNDTIKGGAGVNVITAGTGNDSIFSGTGSAKVSAAGSGARVTCGGGHVEVSVPSSAVAFALANKCKSKFVTSR